MPSSGMTAPGRCAGPPRAHRTRPLACPRPQARAGRYRFREPGWGAGQTRPPPGSKSGLTRTAAPRPGGRHHAAPAPLTTYAARPPGATLNAHRPLSAARTQNRMICIRSRQYLTRRPRAPSRRSDRMADQAIRHLLRSVLLLVHPCITRSERLRGSRRRSHLRLRATRRVRLQIVASGEPGAEQVAVDGVGAAERVLRGILG